MIEMTAGSKEAKEGTHPFGSDSLGGKPCESAGDDFARRRTQEDAFPWIVARLDRRSPAGCEPLLPASRLGVAPRPRTRFHRRTRTTRPADGPLRVRPHQPPVLHPLAQALRVGPEAPLHRPQSAHPPLVDAPVWQRDDPAPDRYHRPGGCVGGPAGLGPLATTGAAAVSGGLPLLRRGARPGQRPRPGVGVAPSHSAGAALPL